MDKSSGTSVYADAKNGGKEADLKPMWKRLMKPPDLEKPITFLDQVYSGCTEREFKANSSLVDGYRKRFESLISAGATEKLLDSGTVDTKITTWFYDMEGRAKKCVERLCELANKRHRAFA